MVRLILLCAIIVAVLIIYQQVRSTPKQQRKSLYWKIALFGLGAVLIGSVVTGRMHWMGAIVGAVLPFLQRLLPNLARVIPLFQLYQRHKAGSASSVGKGNQSTVGTASLSMQLDHDTGHLSGRVLAGSYKGAILDDLELQQLYEVLDYCQQSDPESVPLLQSYLDHRFGDNWQHGETNAPSSLGSINSKAEALAILGLDEDASKDDVISAHRRLMQKLHPDRGGNDYLASRINTAKDYLLKNT